MPITKKYACIVSKKGNYTKIIFPQKFPKDVKISAVEVTFNDGGTITDIEVYENV